MRTFRRFLTSAYTELLSVLRLLRILILLEAAIDRFGAEHIVVGVDAKDGLVAIEGWEKVSDKTALSLALAMKDIGVTDYCVH